MQGKCVLSELPALSIPMGVCCCSMLDKYVDDTPDEAVAEAGKAVVQGRVSAGQG